MFFFVPVLLYLSQNFIGHVMMTQALIPLLKKTPQLAQQHGPSRVVNISARVGSISDNHLGGWMSYRCSKAALNMFTKTLSLEVKRQHIYTCSLHPGTTKTDLSKPFQKNVKPDKLFSVEHSVEQMLQVIWDLDQANTGKFYAFDGKTIEW